MSLLPTNLQQQATQPQCIRGTFPAGYPSTLGLSYNLSHASFLKPGEADTTKQLHGTNHWVAQGSVTASPEGLLLDATTTHTTPTWASPYLWSGLKNIQISTRLKYDSAGQSPSLGIKLGRVWAIADSGPRITFDPVGSAINLLGESGKTLASSKATLLSSTWLDITVLYCFDDDLLQVSLNNQPVLKTTLRRKPLAAYMQDLGRPPPVTGIGLFAHDCRLTVSAFSFFAGAPQNRIVALGDSITQQAHWVHALEEKLAEPITNLGIGGDAAKMANLRFDRDVLPLKPQILILFLGTNDVAWGASPSQLANDYLLPMIRRAKDAGIRVILCELIPRKGYLKTPDFNAAIHKLAQDESLPVIAWFAATLDPSTNQLKPGFATDGVHPDLLGAQAMIRAVNPDLFEK